jgi:hypothetical protein
MKATLDAFLGGIGDLRRHVEGLQIEWALLAANTAEPACSAADELAGKLQRHIGAGVAKRQFDYNSIVISLYGLLEQFIEGLIRGYANRLNALTPDYGSLPEPIRNAHVELSFTLLSRIDQPRYRGVVTRETLVANLHSCLSNAKPYTLNTEAFAHHSANFRVEVIDAAFARVGFPAISLRLRHFPAFAEYLESAFPGVELPRLTPEEIFAILNDLAERRNEVAHGQPSELLSNEILLQYVAFIEAYSSALYDAVNCDALLVECKSRGISLGAPIAVYNNNIVCVELKDTPIKVGDILIAQTGAGPRPVIAGEILELQVDKVPTAAVAAAPSVKVGARVGYHAKDNHTFVLLPTT